MPCHFLVVICVLFLFSDKLHVGMYSTMACECKMSKFDGVLYACIWIYSVGSKNDVFSEDKNDVST